MLDHDAVFSNLDDRNPALSNLNWIDENGKVLSKSILNKTQLYNLLVINSNTTPSVSGDGTVTSVAPDITLPMSYTNTGYYLMNKMYLQVVEKSSFPGYWINTEESNSDYAYMVTYADNVSAGKKTSTRGIRPVITINKSIFGTFVNQNA